MPSGFPMFAASVLGDGATLAPRLLFFGAQSARLKCRFEGQACALQCTAPVQRDFSVRLEGNLRERLFQGGPDALAVQALLFGRDGSAGPRRCGSLPGLGKAGNGMSGKVPGAERY